MGREKRKYFRKYCKITVTMKRNGTKEVVTDGIRNISEGGIFVNTYNPLPVGSEIDLEFKIPEIDRVTKCRGSVMWGYYPDLLKDGMDLPGIGIEMLDISPMDVGVISDFIVSSKEECHIAV